MTLGDTGSNFVLTCSWSEEYRVEDGELFEHGMPLLSEREVGRIIAEVVLVHVDALSSLERGRVFAHSYHSIPVG